MIRILFLLVISVMFCCCVDAQEIKSGKLRITTLYKDKNMSELRDVTGPVEFYYYGDYLMELLKRVSITDTTYITKDKPSSRSVQEKDVGFFLINLKRRLYHEYKITEGEVFSLINSDSLAKKNKGAEVPADGFILKKRDIDIRKQLGDTLIKGKRYCRVQFIEKTDTTHNKIIYFISKNYDLFPESLRKLWFTDECGGGVVNRMDFQDYKKEVQFLIDIDFFPNTLTKEETERFKKYINDFN